MNKRISPLFGEQKTFNICFSIRRKINITLSLPNLLICLCLSQENIFISINESVFSSILREGEDNKILPLLKFNPLLARFTVLHLYIILLLSILYQKNNNYNISIWSVKAWHVSSYFHSSF